MSTLTGAARCTLAVLSAACFSVHAQIAPSTSGALEEIVVTAQKREQNSQDIGISLSAITGADLNSLGAATAADITKSMPAVVLTQPNGPTSFSLAIRGVTQNDFADHQESPAAITASTAACRSNRTTMIRCSRMSPGAHAMPRMATTSIRGKPRQQALRSDGIRQHLDQRPRAGLPRHAALVQDARELPVLDPEEF